MGIRMTEEEYKAFLARTQSAPAPSSAAKQSKYFNKKVYVYEDGYTSTEKSEGHGRYVEHFDSVKEYQRCMQLRALEKSGAISELDTQKSMLIQPAFRDKKGYYHRAITYRADFAYIQDGEQIIEDVKAFDTKKRKYLTTEVFRLKWKLLQAKYPDYTFKLY